MVIKRIYSKLRHWYNRKWLHKTEMDIKIEEMRRRGYIIGEKCHLYSALGTAEPYLVEIKDNVTISYDVSVITHDNAPIKVIEGATDIVGKIVIGNNVRIGGDCIVIDSDCHSLNYVHRRGAVSDMLNTKSKQITIEDDVMIGARCIILKGVVIGARSVIGAGAVVTRSIPADCIACGNPAKIIKRI